MLQVCQRERCQSQNGMLMLIKSLKVIGGVKAIAIFSQRDQQRDCHSILPSTCKNTSSDKLRNLSPYLATSARSRVLSARHRFNTAHSRMSQSLECFDKNTTSRQAADGSIINDALASIVMHGDKAVKKIRQMDKNKRRTSYNVQGLFVSNHAEAHTLEWIKYSRLESSLLLE
ncbi:hypothetical protein EVAR_73081_1 [Eumeta japonica]|uniref:Uncharacterized protein n=1 Tax=Eumeta variegata TaxID=151549 RepID=A0A4C1SUJ7_EUMVA|nr:hypothetical protein EVAR_73081_1 [Eumeta japonica]